MTDHTPENKHHCACEKKCCCETTELCRLEVERSATFHRNVTVENNLTVEGKLLPFNRTVAVREVGLAVPSGVFVTVTWPAATNQGLFIAANSADFVAPRDGVYGFTAVIQFDPLVLTSSLRSIMLFVDTTRVVTSDFGQVAFGSVSAVLYLQKDQVVQLRVFQNSGSQLNVTGRFEINQLR